MSEQLLISEDYQKVLQFINAVQLNRGDCRYSILKHLSAIFSYSNLTFLVVDEEGILTNPLGLNVSSQLCQMYTQYYYKTDIFHPLNIPTHLFMSKKVISTADIMSYGQYENTEYYNDFLKKDNFYYQVSLPLSVDHKLIGGIGIFRTKEEGCFTNKDVEILNYVSTYIAHCLFQFQQEELNRCETKNYSNCIYRMPFGFVCLDQRCRVVYHNEPAALICERILQDTKSGNHVEAVLNKVLSTLDLSVITSSTCIHVQYADYNFKIALSLIPDYYLGVKTYYHVFMYKTALEETASRFHVDNSCKLSQREYEIIMLIAEGLTNKMISEKLFISVNTVRTHIDNIFNKLDVGSRIEILYKLGLIENSKPRRNPGLKHQ